MNGGKLAMAAVSAIGIGVLAGCTGSSSSTGSSVTAPSSTIAFVPITEPFDPGHPAHTAQFYYDDGYFKDAGIVERPHPAGHRVTPGTEYTFSIDYSAMPHDPYRAEGAGGFVYASPMTGAVWR